MKKTKTKLILTIMNILFWVIFIGLCIKTGAIIISSFVSLFVNPEAAKDLHLGLNLFELRQFDLLHYVILVSFIIFLSGLKAYFAYWVVKISLKLNFAQSFSPTVAGLIMKISNTAWAIAILALLSNVYGRWLIGRGIGLPALQDYLGKGSEYLFFAGVIFIIAQIFKRGIEIQSENELTI